PWAVGSATGSRLAFQWKDDPGKRTRLLSVHPSKLRPLPPRKPYRHRACTVMASQDGDFRTRADDDTGRDFKRQNAELLQGQSQQFSASWRQRQREIESFAASRAEAIKQHAARIEAIDSREVKAAQELAKKQNS